MDFAAYVFLGFVVLGIMLPTIVSSLSRRAKEAREYAARQAHLRSHEFYEQGERWVNDRFYEASAKGGNAVVEFLSNGNMQAQEEVYNHVQYSEDFDDWLYGVQGRILRLSLDNARQSTPAQPPQVTVTTNRSLMSEAEMADEVLRHLTDRRRQRGSRLRPAPPEELILPPGPTPEPPPPQDPPSRSVARRARRNTHGHS